MWTTTDALSAFFALLLVVLWMTAETAASADVAATAAGVYDDIQMGLDLRVIFS